MSEQETFLVDRLKATRENAVTIRQTASLKLAHEMQSQEKRCDDIIERFFIRSEGGYSEYWRRDKSPVEVLELAKLLLSIRKITSYVGRNIGTIVWTGMECPNEISLDPSIVIGEYPVPAAKTDIMVGIAVRKSYQKTEWSEYFKNLALSQLNLRANYAYKFNLFFDMSEKVYADILSNRSVLGFYTETARQWEIGERYKEFLNPPTVVELLHVWWRMAADRSRKKYKEEYVDRSADRLVKTESLERFYKEPITLLNSIVDRLIYECPKISGAVERGKFRVSLYTSIWPKLLDYFKFWVTDRADPYLLPDLFRAGIEKEGEEGKALRAMIVNFADQIERCIRIKSVDFTEQVKANVKNIDDVVRIEWNDIVIPTKDRINKNLLHNLKLIIKSAAQRKPIYNRGLTSGKIDRRRLYRISTTGKAFHLKKNDFELVNDIILLVDCTGSMATPTKWEYAETIWQTLFSAIRIYNPNAKIFGYNEVKDICHITGLYINGKYYTLFPHGKTASAEAIIATALSLKKRTKRPFIIHITDGASNWGCGVSNALAYCKKNRIHLLTLGLGCDPSSKQSLREDYGNLVQFLDDISDLPKLFRMLLNYSKLGFPP